MAHVDHAIVDPERGGSPPGAAVAASDTHYVTAVEDEVTFVDRADRSRVYDASLASFFEPVLERPKRAAVSDPRAAYDPIDDAFYLVAAVQESDGDGVTDSYLVVGAGQQGDPTRGWNYTRLDPGLPTGYWVSFPGLGFDENCVYLTANVYDDERTYARSQFLAADKHELLWRSSVTYNRIDGLGTAGDVRAFQTFPCQNYGWSAGGSAWCIWAPYFGGSHVEVMEIADPLQATPDDVVRHEVSVPDFETAPTSAAQPGTDDGLQVVGASFVRRGVIVDDSLWCAHAVGYDTDGDGERESRIDWYEIDLGGPIEARQASDVTPKGGYAWAPAIEHDRSGATAMLSYYASDSGPATIVTHYRTADRKRGEMSTKLIEWGESGYDTPDRSGTEFWGEYFGLARDPTSDAQFVGYGQYPASEAVDGDYDRLTVNFGV